MNAIARLGCDASHHVTSSSAQRGGSDEAHNLLRSFLHRRSRRYQSELSSMLTAPTSCSRLSPHLAWGSISVRSVWQSLRDRAQELGSTNQGWLRSLEGFAARLKWRAHNMQKFESNPDSEFRNIVRGYDGIRKEEMDSEQQGHFDSWCEGRTGYPLVDACMRCLDATGWLTFRMRCLLVSFACYHLWLHWRAPAIWLARRFVDFEPGIHYCQVQMQAGTAEFVEMRVYNPTKQALDQDPEGVYIKQWVPELQNVPKSHVHEPSKMSIQLQRECGCEIGVDYPAPVVAHSEAYGRAKKKLQAAREQMGFPQAVKRSRQQAAAAGSRDLVEMFAQHSSKRHHVAPATECANSGPRSGAQACTDITIGLNNNDHNQVEQVTCDRSAVESLVALGFPPDIVTKAVGLFPTDINKAADWILQGDW